MTPAHPVAAGPAELAIVCVTHDSAHLLADFLRAALSGHHPGAHRLVVVDSASTDDTVSATCGLSPLVEVCVMTQNRGFAAGINVGVDHVRRTGGAHAFVVVNPDVLLTMAQAATLVAALGLRGVGIACPMIVDQHGVRDDTLSRMPGALSGLVSAFVGSRAAGSLGLTTEVLRDEGWYDAPHAVGWATGGALAISDECLRRVGPWTEEFFMYEEEVDFCERASHVGFRVWYTPAAVVTRIVAPDADAPWRHALSQVNRLRREHDTWRGSVRRVQFVVENSLRLHRPRSRAALWAVLHRATPLEVMGRYHPNARIAVGPAAPVQPTPYEVRQSLPLRPAPLAHSAGEPS